MVTNNHLSAYLIIAICIVLIGIFFRKILILVPQYLEAQERFKQLGVYYASRALYYKKIGHKCYTPNLLFIAEQYHQKVKKPLLVYYASILTCITIVAVVLYFLKNNLI